MAPQSAHPAPTSPEFLFGRLQEEVARATRHRLPLTLLMFHLTTAEEHARSRDALTRAAVALTRAAVRRSDVVGALRSGEFGILANATREGAGTLAQYLIRQLQGFEFTHEARPVEVRLRYSVSCLGERTTAEELLDEARAALGCPNAPGQASGEPPAPHRAT